MSTILVVVAHADDEALGCGGTMARHAAAGDAVHVAILADGVTARAAKYTPGLNLEEIESREAAARKACQILGAQEPHFFRLPDNRCDAVPLIEIAKIIEGIIVRVRPDTVLTHHAGDLNIDHRRVHEAVLTAARPLAGQTVRRIHCFEVLSSTEWSSPISEPFRPQRFVDISKTLDLKLAAVAAYDAEMRPFPHPRSAEAITSLARLRGATAGLQAAEAFTVVRDIADQD